MSRKSNAAVAKTAESTAEVVTKGSISPAIQAQIDKVDLSGAVTKSAQIRLLAANGIKTGDIARHLSVVHGKEMKYQHVRNVLNQPAPKSEMSKPNTGRSLTKEEQDAIIVDRPDLQPAV